MNAAAKIVLRLVVMVGLMLAFLYYHRGLRAATENQFDALNAKRQEINEMRAGRQLPRMRTEI